MSKGEEKETYIVTIERGRDKEFGNWVSEMWFKQSTGENFRPDDQPSFHRYDPITKETLEAEYSLEGQKNMAREGGKLFYINRGSKCPHKHYKLNNHTVRTVWPNFEADEKTRRLKYENYDDYRHYHDSKIPKKPDPTITEPS